MAYSLKMDKTGACAVAYTGEGATSEVNSLINDQFEIINVVISQIKKKKKNNAGRFSCWIELCSCFGSSCYLPMPE